METQYDQELRSYIDRESLATHIEISHTTDEIVKAIETNYTMGFSGVDWTKNKVIYTERLDSNLEIYLQQAKILLEKIASLVPALLDERVIVIGDNLTYCAYHMPFEEFLKMSDAFLSIPQHIYIWFPISKKCMNFTFENEFFFG
jgi:hypothetical protein